jgi:hypothetical protein
LPAIVFCEDEWINTLGLGIFASVAFPGLLQLLEGDFANTRTVLAAEWSISLEAALKLSARHPVDGV